MKCYTQSTTWLKKSSDPGPSSHISSSFRLFLSSSFAIPKRRRSQQLRDHLRVPLTASVMVKEYPGTSDLFIALAARDTHATCACVHHNFAPHCELGLCRFRFQKYRNSDSLTVFGLFSGIDSGIVGQKNLKRNRKRIVF